MAESLTVDGLTFALERSGRRRTLVITVERDGALRVIAPTALPAERIEAAVRDRLLWVYEKLAEKELVLHPATAKRYVAGEGFFYLGRSYRLFIEADPGGPALQLARGRFVLREGERGEGERHFTRWYEDHARAWLSRRAALFAPRVGVTAAEVRVRDLGNRWGSCGATGRLNFHWRVICLPPTAVEYVVVHELAHLAESRHDARFWARVERALPDFAERKRWLAENGSRY